MFTSSLVSPVVPPVVSVAVGGSRVLSAEGAALAVSVGRLLALRGRALRVGCALGADSAVLAGFLSEGGSFGRVFAVSGPVELPRVARAVAASGFPVAWWAGGGASVPVSLRLAVRSRVCVSSASAALFVLGSPVSRGSLGAARFAVSVGVPVWVSPVGFSVSALPSLSAGGAWVLCSASSTLFGAAFFRWSVR